MPFDRQYYENQPYKRILERFTLPVSPALIESLSHRLERISKLPLGAAKVSAQLNASGIRRIGRQDKAGYSSIVVPFSHAPQVLKISTRTETLMLDNHDEILHPIKIIDETDPVIAVYPEVEPGNVPKEKIEQLVISLLRKGILFFDPLQRNVALLDDKNRTPIIIDQDNTIDIRHKDEICPLSSRGLTYAQLFQSGFGQSIESIDISKPILYDFGHAQQDHLKKHSLQTGKVTGVFSDEDLLQMDKLFNSNSFSGMIKNSHLDEALFSRALGENLGEWSGNDRKAWREHLERTGGRDIIPWRR